MTSGRRAKIGDRVTLTGIPPDTRDLDDLKTRTLFEKCLGKTFTVKELENVEGLPFQLVKLDVGHIVGRDSSLETIWVELEYLRIEDLASS